MLPLGRCHSITSRFVRAGSVRPEKTWSRFLPRQFSKRTFLRSSRFSSREDSFPTKTMLAVSLLGMTYSLFPVSKQKEEEFPELQAWVGKGEAEVVRALQVANGSEQLYPMTALGDLSLQRALKETDKQKVVHAAGLYNYALHLSEKDAHVRALLLKKLAQAEKELLLLCGAPLPSFFLSQLLYGSCPTSFTQNRSTLSKQRREVEGEIESFSCAATPQEVRKVCHTISTGMKQFTADLITESVQQLGAPPCGYAVVGFGSLAREEMTSRSDLEFAILIEDEKQVRYFENLAYLLHFKVVNLGETILPCLNIPCLRETGFYDGVTPRGFSFDGEGGGLDEFGIATKGCKTPFGNRHTFHLIHTPERMAAFQGKDVDGRYWIEKEPHLPMELVAHTFINGDQLLAQQYKVAVDQKLGRPYREGTMRSYLAKEHLYGEDSDRFDPKLGLLEKEGELFEVKNDLYRLPHLLIDRLACFFSLRSLNTLDRIDELEERRVFQPEAAKNVKELVAATTKLRLETYQFYQKQKGIIHAFPIQLGFRKKGNQFFLGEKAFEQLEKIYQVLLPFNKAMDRFFWGESGGFGGEVFWDETSFTLGKIASRLLQYQKAAGYYLEAREREPENSLLLNALGLVLIRLGHNAEGIKIFQKALEVDEATYGKGDLNVMRSLNNLAFTYQKQGKLKDALPLFEEVLKVTRANYGLEDPKTARALNNVAFLYKLQEKSEEALLLFKEALRIDRAAHGEQNPNVAIRLNNLASMYEQIGELDSALSLFEEAFEIDKTVYGEFHPSVARRMNNIADVYRQKGDLTRALSLLIHALEIKKYIYGETSPYVATGLNNLAVVYMDQSAFTCAEDIFKRVVQMDKATYGEQHPAFATGLSNLALVYRNTGRLSDALTLLRRALQIDEVCYGKHASEVAKDLDNIALIYLEQGAARRALLLLERAVEIMEKSSPKENSETKKFRDHLRICKEQLNDQEE